MPMPKPLKNENEKEFISRFMSNKTMIKEYPDEEQRLAVAYQQWNRLKKSCVCNLIKSIDKLVKADDEELKQDLKLYIELDYTIKRINVMENFTYKLLREELNHYIRGIKDYVSKGRTEDILNYVKRSLLASDDFVNKYGRRFNKFLDLTTEQLTDVYLKSIDKELFFSYFSDRTTDFIDSWSKELAELIHETSYNELDSILKVGLEEGKGINDIAKDLRNSYGFSRTRSRTIAITEVLTAHSHAGFESAIQNPSVDRVTWRHSGIRGITPRPNHVALDGKTIKKGEWFDLGTEQAQYPRQTSLSAKERVRCHCLLQQVVDDEILGLSLERRQQLQKEAIESDNRIYNRKARSK